jgi:GC-rich sequence DNA-binding factor
LFLAQIEDEVSKIFEDVCDEFCDLDLILQKFNEWKKRDIKTYKEAYIHLCLPKIVGIFSRIQSITWNPLIQGFALDKMAWYHPSMLHGVNPKETIANLRNDPDLYLVPMVIEKTILAKISRKLKSNFQP